MKIILESLHSMILIEQLSGVNVKKIFYILVPLSCVIAYCTIALYSLSESNIEDIIICSSNNETHYIPDGICELYLLNYRATENDIQFLETRSGLAFLFGIQNENKRYNYLEYFLSKGISIDALNSVDGLSPLHAAVVLNDLKLVEYLLDKGASATQIDKNYGLTPLELLQKLNVGNNPMDRDAIAKILSSASDKSK